MPAPLPLARRRSYHRHILVAIAALLVYLWYSAPVVDPEEVEEHSIEAMISCQNELAQRMRSKVVALADWEPEMVAYLDGSAYHVRSYVEAGPDTLHLRRIEYECRAKLRSETDWRIDAMCTWKGL
jgi:hypothetical protein